MIQCAVFVLRRLSSSGALACVCVSCVSPDGYGVGSGRRPGRARRSSDCYEESEADEMTRIFVALFDYDPLSMSPNPDGPRFRWRALSGERTFDNFDSFDRCVHFLFIFFACVSTSKEVEVHAAFYDA